MCYKRYVYGLCFECFHPCVFLTFSSCSLTVILKCIKSVFINLSKLNCTAHYLTLEKMPRFSEAERNQAIGMLRVCSDSEVARHFNVSRKTVRKLKQRMQVSGTVADRPRSGRPRKTSGIEDRHIRTRHLRNCMLSAARSARTFPGNQ